MERLITEDIKRWYDENVNVCLLIDGARQVGKTYIVREFAKKYCKSFVEINLLENEQARVLLSGAKSSEEIFLYLRTLFPNRLIPGKTVIFFDEVQECLELVTAVKFLVEEGSFRYILSGSLLGVEMSNVKSVPVGYMQVLQMYPMNFMEFCMAVGCEQTVFDYLRECFVSVKPVSEAIHDRFMKQLKVYLIVGGMPAAVQRYIQTKDIAKLRDIHEYICNTYRADISKYDRANRPMIKNIFDLIPSELNCQNKRFNYSSVEQGRKSKYVENAFVWLTDAGVAIPVYCANEPRYPLIMSKSRNLMKLFLCDVGLLSYMYFDDNIQYEILADTGNINYGAIYENYVAQEMKGNGLVPYYFKSNKYGELDLLIEINSEVIPLEVKSGKNYKKYSALNNVLDVHDYNIQRAYVFNNTANIEAVGKIIHVPVYMTMFLKKERRQSLIVDIDGMP
ncbi:MAG: ATP-binding protein [Clostridia bacterium]|nr:ATP-binding protein [Clostridia bacterium]